MRYFLPLSMLLATAALTACGGSDNTGTQTGITINTSLKGPASQPALTTVEPDSLIINSKVSGVGNDSFEVWTFRNTTGAHVLVALTSSSGDISPSISNYVARANLGTSSDKLRVFISEVGASTEFRAYVSSEEDYELILTELNRETAKLKENEYLVYANVEYEEDCDDYYDYDTYSYYRIINLTDGYIKGGWEETPFTSVSGDTVTITYQDDETDLNGTAEFKVNGESGNVTGTDLWSYTGDSDNCTHKETITGKIIL